MKPSDFFTWVEIPEWGSSRSVFDADLVDSFRLRPREGINDLDAAYGLAQLARDELIAHGTNGSKQLNDEAISVALRSLKAILRRLGIQFDLPFRDFTRFRDHWIKMGMSGEGVGPLVGITLTPSLSLCSRGLSSLRTSRRTHRCAG